MLKVLLGHNWKRIRRSPDFQKNVATNFIVGLMFTVVFLDVLIIGLLIDRVLKDIAPAADVVTTFNGLLLYYFCFDLVSRFLIQKMHALSARPYLVLPVQRHHLVSVLLVKSLLTWFNFVPLLIIVPAFVNLYAGVLPPLSSAAWLVSVISLLLFNSYMSTYLRNRALVDVTAAVLMFVSLAGLAGLEKFGVLRLSEVSSAVFAAITLHPGLAAVPLAGLIAIIFVNYRHLRHSLYLDIFSHLQRRQSFSGSFSFLERYGHIGALLRLELKMILRNKRPKTILFFTVFMLFYGFLVYRDKDVLGLDVILLFAGCLIIGMFTIAYGAYMFSWESGYFGTILTKKIDFREYLRAKYLLMMAVSSIAYLASFMYYQQGLRLILINTMIYLYMIGVIPFVLLFLSTFNKVRFDLSAGPFSQQGRTGIHYATFFIVLGTIFVIFVPVKMLAGSNAAFTVLGSLGLAGVLTHRRIIELLVQHWVKRKYIMSAGFRQS